MTEVPSYLWDILEPMELMCISNKAVNKKPPFRSILWRIVAMRPTHPFTSACSAPEVSLKLQ